MKTQVLLLAAASAVYAADFAPRACPCFSEVFAYGDSLTDTGNAFRLTGRKVPPSPPYTAGRFSDGALWVEYFADILRAPFTSYAFGGATTNNAFVPSGITDAKIPVPSLYDQVHSSMIGTDPASNPDRLYAIWIGGNDYVNTQFKVNTTQLVGQVKSIVNSIVGYGGKNIMVFGLPPVGQTPLGMANGGPIVDQVTSGYNDAVANMLVDLEDDPKFPTDVELYYVDMIGIFNKLVNDPANGFTIKDRPCFDATKFTVCNGTKPYAFFDALHPTTRLHRLIAWEVVRDVLDITDHRQYQTKCASGKVRMCLNATKPPGQVNKQTTGTMTACLAANGPTCSARMSGRQY
eukprot:comp12633_c0_seq1/m.7682 comp12633_c0_seq1/g.7682  ORF comp12633_c0_seq1/g.7682 comp12633_c0_seq1/m.7682 type:complete len:348 (-) comp12633_c0_seq1:572-1615(-)